MCRALARHILAHAVSPPAVVACIRRPQPYCLVDTLARLTKVGGRNLRVERARRSPSSSPTSVRGSRPPSAASTTSSRFLVNQEPQTHCKQHGGCGVLQEGGIR